MDTAELTLPLDRIHGDPGNVRTRVNVNGIKDLAASIKGVGLQQPVIVTPQDDGYRVIAGHRRIAAIGLLVDAGEHDGQVPVIVRTDLSDADVLLSQLVENLQREDIDPLDEANGYMRLLQFDMSQADIARQVGRSRAHITKRLALLTLPDTAKDQLRKQNITIEHALAIAALDDEDREAYCEEGQWNEFSLSRLLRGSKGKKAATALAAKVEGLGLEVVDTIDQDAAPEGFFYETVEIVYSDQWDGVTVPEGASVAVVQSTGETASARFLALAERDTKKATREEKAEAKAKEAKKAERLAERAKQDFLVNALTKVKASDANDLMLNLVLDRVGWGNAKELCLLLDLEVPVKEETSYDGKTREVKQYGPLILALVKQARDDGDIGFLRRVVVALAVISGYRDHVLDLYGFDPSVLEDA